MKKYIVVILLIAAMSSFSSCKKYEDGPAFSLLSKKVRIDNTWAIDKVYRNGTDITESFRSTYSGYLLYIFQNGTYSLSWTTNSAIFYSEVGKWKFTDRKRKIRFTSSRDEYERKIRRLSNTELWVEYSENGDDYIIHYRGLIY